MTRHTEQLCSQCLNQGPFLQPSDQRRQLRRSTTHESQYCIVHTFLDIISRIELLFGLENSFSILERQKLHSLRRGTRKSCKQTTILLKNSHTEYTRYMDDWRSARSVRELEFETGSSNTVENEKPFPRDIVVTSTEFRAREG